MMTDAELNEIETRASLATAGPWKSNYKRHDVYGPNDKHVCHFFEESYIDAEFIAAAREDVPRLVAEVRRLKEEAGGLQHNLELMLIDNEQLIRMLDAISDYAEGADNA